MFRRFYLSLGAEMLVGYLLLCGVTGAYAQNLKVTVASAIDWRAVLASPASGFVMKYCETRKGNGVVSFGELKSLRIVPQAAWKQYRKALSEDDKRHYLESFRLATSATMLCPQFPQAHTALAVWHLRNLDLASAEQELRIASNLDPYYLPARELSGIVLLIKGRLLYARKSLEAVVETDSTRPLAQYFLASTLSELGEFALAAEHSETANQLRRHPPKPSAFDDWSLATPE